MLETTTENQQERLIVKNFGPLKDVDIELKDIMVFIGPQASGKSTLAKILYLINSIFDAPANVGFGRINIEEDLKRFNINFSSKNTEINYIVREVGYFYIKDKELIFEFSPEIKEMLKEFGEALEKFKNAFPQMLDNLSTNLRKLGIISSNLNIKKDHDEVKKPVQIEQMDVTHQPDIEKKSILDNFIKKSTYIPAERNTISNLSNSIMGVLADGVSIPKFILEFGRKFEIARNELKKIHIDFLNVTYKYGFEIGNRIFISPKKSISLSEAASGIQSVVPLYLVTKHFAENDLLVIEEPELNLFPETQKKLVEFIIETCRDKTKRLIITTHSPYILTTLNGLIQAHNTARTKPELKDKVAEIIPENRWIDFDKIGVYHVADGTVKRIMDDEYRLIDANPIDDVSDKLGREFDELLDLKYDE